MLIQQYRAAELVSKATDTDFMRRARVTDILGRAWESLRVHAKTSSDVVLDACSLAFVAFASRDPRSLDDLRQRDGFETLLTESLTKDRSSDPFAFASEDFNADDAKHAGVGKSERRMVRRVILPSFSCLTTIYF